MVFRNLKKMFDKQEKLKEINLMKYIIVKHLCKNLIIDRQSLCDSIA